MTDIVKHVFDLPRRDASIYEDTETGERRTVTGKSRVMYGLVEAWKRAKKQTDTASESETTG